MKKRVRVVTRIQEEDGDKILIYGQIQVELVSSRRYHNTLPKLSHLSPCARLLLDYMIEQMSGENVVRNDKKLRQNFNAVIKASSNTEYSHPAMHKAVAELLSQDLLLRIGSRGTLRVNPLYFHKGDERHRLKLIKQVFSK